MYALYVLLEVDPNTVKPGWTPLIITIALAAVIALLMISMRRHMRRVDLPHRDEVEQTERDERAEQQKSAGGARPTE